MSPADFPELSDLAPAPPRTAAPGSGASWVTDDQTVTAARVGPAGQTLRLVTGLSLEDLAGPLERGRAVVLLVNAGEALGQADRYAAGDANTARRVRAVVRQPNGVVGGAELDGVGFVPADRLARGWLAAGGLMLVADQAG